MKEILDEKAMDRALTRIAHEIIENNEGVEDLVIIGIKTRGEYLAKRIVDKINKIEGGIIKSNAVDITFYRDDLEKITDNPTLNEQFEMDVYNKTVVLVDDVMYTGRTCRAAMDAIMKTGRAKKIQFAALIDRGHRELPIAPNYIGKNLPTAKHEVVEVHVKEIDDEDIVILT